MAFFTRANVNIPVLPSDEVTDKENQRFEYTVDRTLGVEVWNLK